MKIRAEVIEVFKFYKSAGTVILIAGFLLGVVFAGVAVYA